MIQPNNIYLMDCLEGMRNLPDKSVDLVVTDPPYSFVDDHGGGAFGTCRGKAKDKQGRKYHTELAPMSKGITNEYLDQMCRVCKIPYIYIFCSKDQLPQFLNYAKNHKFYFDVLCWHKSNPIPTCCGKYLSDTEYIVLMRGKGTKILGSYETKRKFYVTKLNTADKRKYGHPTCKPVHILKNFIINSSQENDIILDPFMGGEVRQSLA